MLIRVVDYVSALGGGGRFVAQMIEGLLACGSDIQLELVSHGRGIDDYRSMLEERGLSVRLIDQTPKNLWGLRSSRFLGIKGTARLRRLLVSKNSTFYEVPDDVFDGCDVIWFPWAHQHRIRPSLSGKVVASIHDLILIQLADLFVARRVPVELLSQERETMAHWLSSDAALVVSSASTLSALQEIYRVPRERVHMVPILAGHVPQSVPQLSREWEWTAQPFLLHPANITVHKNHDSVLKAVAHWGFRWPLVLAGLGTDAENQDPRAAAIREQAKNLGFKIGENLIFMGYVNDQTYYALLRQAAAVVVATLGEGGGSFPVLEAMLSGTPVLCSDIPVMREQMQRTGGEAIWFNPRDHSDLADKLHQLDASYDFYKSRAMEQVSSMHVLSWGEVADQYLQIMREVARASSGSERHARTVRA